MVNLLSDYVELNRLDPVEYVEQEKRIVNWITPIIVYCYRKK